MKKQKQWLDAPTVSGIYWAWREKGTNPEPSLCKVNMLSNEKWRVTFLGGVESYTFTQAGGWQWMLQDKVSPPARKKVPA